MSNSTTLLDTITTAQAQKEVTANAMFDAASQAMVFGRRASTTTALTWGYYGGAIWLDGVLTAIANGTVALTASNTNYVERTRAGVVSKNVTGFTAGQVPLYEVVTGVSTITSYTDRRIHSPQFTGRLSKSVAGSSNVTLTAAESRNNILVFTGVLTGSINVIVPTDAQEWTVFNNTSGAFTLTVKTTAGTGVAVTQGKKNILHADGTNVVASFDDGNSGTVTSVAVTVAPSSLFDVSGSPVTTSGTIAITMDTQSANLVLAGPASGSAAAPTARALVVDDGLCYATGGRLTLTSAAPVLVSDVSGSTSIYYALYAGNKIALYDGTSWTNTTFTELTNTTTDSTKNPAAVANNSNYDLFVWSDSGTLRLGRGPAWTSDTGRGTGAGTTELERVNGVLVNKIAITNGAAAQRGIYVGSVRSNGSAQIDYKLGSAAAGGGAAFLYVWNMYNRVAVAAMVRDSTASWTTTSATYESLDASTGNRVSWLQGINEDGVSAQLRVFGTNSATGQTAVAISLDGTTTIDGSGGFGVGPGILNNVETATYSGYPGLGLHFLQAVQSVQSGTGTWYGNLSGIDREALTAQLRM